MPPMIAPMMWSLLQAASILAREIQVVPVECTAIPQIRRVYS